MALECLSQGLPVYYYGLYNTAVTTLQFSDSNNLVLLINSPDTSYSTFGEWALAEFTDKNKYDFKFISAGAIAPTPIPFGNDTLTFAELCLKIAGNRGDAIALVYNQSGTAKSAKAIDADIQTAYSTICSTKVDTTYRKGYT